ncbi:MAG: GntR family transcriptional regulator [Bacillota bacterium]|nr:GntR family transcriptional regulator [Bacillota bacterium]
MTKPLCGIQYELIDTIEEYIEENNLKENDKLPSERELSRLLNANRVTLREAISRMCKEQRLLSIQGKGTFIAPKKFEIVMQNSELFKECCLKSPYACDVKELYNKKTKPVDVVYLALDLSENETVPTALNVIYLNGEPISFERVYTRENFQINALESSALRRGRIKISISKATENEALILGVEPKCLVFVERTYGYFEDRIAECHISIINAARVSFLSREIESSK